jgi:hypothetical protein
MTLNIPPKVRAAIYILTALGTPIVAYLNAREIIGTLEVTLWSAEVAIVGGMAALKTRPMKGDE